MNSKKSKNRFRVLKQKISIKRKFNTKSFPNAQQFLESSRPQDFDFPKPLMKYIWENPSTPKVYQKLIQSCKFFFLKNPILVLNSLKYCFSSVWKCCTRMKCDGISCNHELRKFDMNEIKGYKIWVAQSFYIRFLCEKSNFVSKFIPKIFRCNLNMLHLDNQNLSYNDLKFLGTGVKECYLTSVRVIYGNGEEEVPLEKIIQIFSSAKKVYINFFFEFYNAACENYVELIDACQSIKEVRFHLIPDVFNVPEFYQCLKRSKNRSLIKIRSATDFNRNFILLKTIVDEILATELFLFVPPIIEYYQQNQTKLEKMEKIQVVEAAKYP